MKNEQGKVLGFFRRNLVYLILALCILAIGLSAIFYFVNQNNSQFEPSINNGSGEIIDPSVNPDDGVNDTPTIKPGDNDQPTGGGEIINPDIPSEPVITTVTFILPVENATEIGKYSELPVFSQTLNRYQSHMAIDFFAPEGTEVLAVYDGTVLSVDTTLLTGTTIVIDHGNGLTTTYNSLLDGEMVSVGQTITKGEVIGLVSQTNRQESKDGAHLHFSVQENGVTINPDKYLQFDNK